MLIKNNGTTSITMNLRDGSSYVLLPGVPTSVPDAATTMIDDSAVLISLFNAGTLTVTTDAGGAFSGFPTTVNATDSAVGKLLPVRAKVSAGGARSLVDETGQAVGAGDTSAIGLVYHIIIGAGQSNMSGRGGTPDARLDSYDQRVFTFDYAGTYAGKIVPAQEPLGHFDSGSNSMGPLLGFAKKYAALTGAGVRVLVVPCAYGGTGFSSGTNRWDVAQAGVAGNYYTQTINQVLAAIAAVQAEGATYKIAAIAWLQGEQDVLNRLQPSAYYSYLSALIFGFRANIPGASSAPFLIGQMSPEYIAIWRDFGAGIDNCHKAIPNLIPLTAYAPGAAGQTQSDKTHYAAAGYRTLNNSYFTAYLAALKNTSPGAQLPGQPTGLTSLLLSGTSIVLGWTPPGSGAFITDNLVSYRVSGTSTWTTVNTGYSSSAFTVTGLTANTSYDFKVTASSLGTFGADSAIVTVNSGAVPSPTPADNFIRADNASSMGATSTGAVAWNALAGTWGISSNAAYDASASPSNSLVVVDSGKSDCMISITMSVLGSFQDQMGACFRMTDVNNGFVISGTFEIYRRQGGSFTSISTGYPVGQGWNAGDTIQIILKGPRITVLRNGLVMNDTTSTFNQTATLHGLRNNITPTSKFSAFSVQ